MKILAIADEKSQLYYDYFRPGRFDEFDVIVSCGDLSKEYLEFIATMSRCPVLYVHGNHDDKFREDPPGGCICIEDDIFEYKGVRFLGLGGSFRYKPGDHFMYTEREMKFRIFCLFFKLKKHKGFDILVTHAPAKDLGDLEDVAHRGFLCFRELLDRYHPKYLIHGHVHRNYGYRIQARTVYKDTMIINAFQHQKIEYASETECEM